MAWLAHFLFNSSRYDLLHAGDTKKKSPHKAVILLVKLENMN
jgi:hypothetical protein